MFCSVISINKTEQKKSKRRDPLGHICNLSKGPYFVFESRFNRLFYFSYPTQVHILQPNCNTTLCDWFKFSRYIVIFTFVLIGRCNYFGFGFTTLNRKALYLCQFWCIISDFKDVETKSSELKHLVKDRARPPQKRRLPTRPSNRPAVANGSAQDESTADEDIEAFWSKTVEE